MHERSSLKVQRPKKQDMCFGYTFLSVAHILCGQNLHLPPNNLKMSTFCTIIHLLYSATIAFSVIFCLVITISTFLKHRDQFKHTLFIASTLLGELECFIRIAYTTLYRKRIEIVAAKVYKTLSCDETSTKQQRFVAKLSRTIVILVTTLFAGFAISISANYVSIYGQLVEIFNENDQRVVNGTEEEINKLLVAKQVPLEVREAWTYVSAIFQLWPSIDLLKVHAAFLHVINFLAIGRIIVSDTLFYSWYAIIINRYNVLAKTVPAALDIKEDNKRLTDWVKFHQTINELLQEVNMLAAPGIIAAVICTCLQICILSYVIVKMHDEAIIWTFLMFGFGSVYQVFVYCLLGQKIKEKVIKLHSEVYKGPWVENEQTKKHAAFIICTASSEKIGHSLPGAPFISMSLEFFASMVSVIFTYFMVLIQLS